MSDMLDTIVAKSEQLCADDLLGRTMTITITGVEITPGEQPVTIHYEGEGNKPYKPCKSMCRVMVALWGPDAKAYVGRSLTLFRDPAVRWGGLEVGGIRIAAMSHIEDKAVLPLTVTKGIKKGFTVKPLKDAPAPKASGKESAEDRVAAGARDLVERVRKCEDRIELEALTSDKDVVKRRAWLAENRQELAEAVDAAVMQAVRRFEEALA